MMPKRNINFEQLPRKGAHVELRGKTNRFYVYVDCNGVEYVVTMTGEHQWLQQPALDRMVYATRRRAEKALKEVTEV